MQDDSAEILELDSSSGIFVVVGNGCDFIIAIPTRSYFG